MPTLKLRQAEGSGYLSVKKNKQFALDKESHAYAEAPAGRRKWVLIGEKE